MDKEKRDQLASLSGEKGVSKFPKYDVPVLKFNGNSGEFRKIVKSESGGYEEVPITSPVELIILKKRKVLSMYTPLKSMYTSEYSSPGDKINLYEKTDGAVSFVSSGFPNEIRASNPQLKTHEIIYGLLGTEVVKFEMKGSSLRNYWDYLTKLLSENKHSFEVITVISPVKEKNQSLGTSYNKMTFESKELNISVEFLEEKIKEVVTALGKIDDYYAQKSNPISAPVSTNTVSEAEDEDIPF